MDLAIRGVPLSVIQQLMGHDDPRTTSIYTVAHAEDLSAALADAASDQVRVARDVAICATYNGQCYKRHK
jgi:integrase